MSVQCDDRTVDDAIFNRQVRGRFYPAKLKNIVCTVNVKIADHVVDIQEDRKVISFGTIRIEIGIVVVLCAVSGRISCDIRFAVYSQRAAVERSVSRVGNAFHKVTAAVAFAQRELNFGRTVQRSKRIDGDFVFIERGYILGNNGSLGYGIVEFVKEYEIVAVELIRECERSFFVIAVRDAQKLYHVVGFVIIEVIGDSARRGSVRYRKFKGFIRRDERIDGGARTESRYRSREIIVPLVTRRNAADRFHIHGGVLFFLSGYRRTVYGQDTVAVRRAVLSHDQDERRLGKLFKRFAFYRKVIGRRTVAYADISRILTYKARKYRTVRFTINSEIFCKFKFRAVCRRINGSIIGGVVFSFGRGKKIKYVIIGRGGVEHEHHRSRLHCRPIGNVSRNLIKVAFVRGFFDRTRGNKADFSRRVFFIESCRAVAVDGKIGEGDFTGVRDKTVFRVTFFFFGKRSVGNGYEIEVVIVAYRDSDDISAEKRGGIAECSRKFRIALFVYGGASAVHRERGVTVCKGGIESA